MTASGFDASDFAPWVFGVFGCGGFCAYPPLSDFGTTIITSVFPSNLGICSMVP
ncbi:MAG: hypothetical protein HYR81_06715, partial [Nitrospirae bacterium]|nr:hypothetical protein [Nitrospirota bacterium]